MKKIEQKLDKFEERLRKFHNSDKELGDYIKFMEDAHEAFRHGLMMHQEKVESRMKNVILDEGW